MSTALESSFNFSDLGALGSLKAAGNTPEARHAIARQFESLFLNLMIRQMRSAGSAIDGGLIDRDKLELHQSMFDQQLALTLSRGNGIGIADSILRSLGEPVAPPAPGGKELAMRLPVTDTAAARSAALLPQPAAGGGAAPRVSAPRAAEPGRVPFDDDNPRGFVASVWPHAERAARELGVAPEALVAQAALETGWGRSLPQNQYGESSFNLFGIKAGSDWPGPRAVVTTLEFVDGLPERRREPFRMYADVGESFDDYVALISGKPRYAQALAAGSTEGYFRGLESAGYATDPDYADKLMGILARGLPGLDQVVTARADSLGNGGRP